MRRTKSPRSLFLALVAGAALAGPVAACPLCKEAFDPSAPAAEQAVGRGYSRSILLMMGTPLVLIGTGAFLVVRAARRGGMPEL